MKCRSGKARAGRDLGGRCPLARAGLLAAGGLDARDLEAPVGANDGEAVAVDGDDLTEFAADAFGILRRQRLGVEDAQLHTVDGRPGTRRRIAAADQPVDLLPRLAPVDAGVVGSALAFVSRLQMVLLDARRLAGLHEIDALEHRLNALREQAVEVNGTKRVGVADRGLLLNEDVAGIEAVVRPEDRQPGFLLTL